MALSVGELAATAGIAPSAVRYYEKAGLLAEPGRKSGRRAYDADAVRDLAFINDARASGLGVAEIRQLVALVRQGGRAEDYCDDAKAFARDKLEEIDRQIAQAQRLRAELAAALEVDCSGQERCSVLSG